MVIFVLWKDFSPLLMLTGTSGKSGCIAMMAYFDLMMLTGEWLSRRCLLQVFVRRGGGKVRKGSGEI